MYGELGFKPWDLHRMTFRDVVNAITGLRDNQEVQQGWIRRATAIISEHAVAPYKKKGDKPIDMDKWWPVKATKKVPGEDRARQTLAKFREVDAKKRANEKLNGRRS